MKQLQNKKALITGASSGIGRALAHCYAQQGAELCLVDVDAVGLNEVAEQCSQYETTVSPIVCDLTKPMAISNLTQRVLDNWGKLDILINNAGVCYFGNTLQMTAEQWDWVLGVNLLAPIQLIREFLPTLLEQPEAYIVNMASIYGIITTARSCAYHTSKFGLVGLSEALRAEYLSHGLSVTCVCPGFVKTELFNNMACPRESVRRKPARWLLASPESVAKRTLRAMLKKQGMVFPTTSAQVLYRLKRFVPGLMSWLTQLRRGKKDKATNQQAIQPPSQAA